MQKALNQKLFYATSLQCMEFSARAQESLLQELKNKPGDGQIWSKTEDETIAALCQGIKQSHADLKKQIRKHRDTVIGMAERIHADLSIVDSSIVDSHGRSGIQRLLPGSVSDRVEHQEHCAVPGVK